jgi:hypothetical protein
VLLSFTTSSLKGTMPSAASQEALTAANGGGAPAMHSTGRQTLRSMS